MLTASQKSKARLFAKWMLLPVMLIVFAGFTLRKEQISNGPNATFTVVIDAGHGGARYGATADDGTMEKDLNLLIAKKIKEICEVNLGTSSPTLAQIEASNLT